MSKSLQSIFMRRTYSMHKDMGRRFAEKRDKNDRIRQHGRELPFTVEQLRAWVQAQMPKTHGQCAYCSKWIDFADFSLDHDIPVSRGGSLELSNLAICCDECNRIKGSLSGNEYRALRRGLETFSDYARKDIYKRLKMGSGFARLRFFSKRKEASRDERRNLEGIQEAF